MLYRPGNRLGQAASRWIHIPWNGWNEQDFRTPILAHTITYIYDPLYRLTAADYSTGESFAYAYDAVGNRTRYTQTITSTNVITYAYDAVNRLTNVDGVAYTWDNNPTPLRFGDSFGRGNLTNDGNKTYTYNQANQLTGISAIGLTWSAAYNGDGARRKQTAVLFSCGDIDRVQRVAHRMGVGVDVVDTRWGIIGVLPRAAAQTRLIHSFLFGVEGRLLLDQQVRNLPVRNQEADMLEKLLDLRLAGVEGIVQHNRRGFESRPKLSIIARGQGGQVRLTSGGRIELLFPKPHVVCLNLDILHHHVFILHKLGIRRKLGRSRTGPVRRCFCARTVSSAATRIAMPVSILVIV